MSKDDPLYVDPRDRDRRHPDRPQHQDFYDLSEVAQALDHAADLGTLTNPLDALDLDEDSLMYFLSERLGILSARTGGAFVPNPMTMALYLDALTVGKRLGEVRAERQGSQQS
jgi:hypothetical protein